MEAVNFIPYVIIIGLTAIIGVILWRSSNRNLGDSEKLELQNFMKGLIPEYREELSRITEQNQKDIAKDLETNKTGISDQLVEVSKSIKEVNKFVNDSNSLSSEKYGEINKSLQSLTTTHTELTGTTSRLEGALNNSQIRGQWGERMADDVLKLAGFIENVNYLKQKNMDGKSKRPDFIFYLPNDLKLNMDVKFPISNYLKLFDDKELAEKNNYKEEFLKSVRGHINNLAGKEYIDPKGGTLDYVLLFIPNESVYSYIHENDNTIMDTALSKKVIFCSPLTLFAILSVIRQSVESFALNRQGENIVTLMGKFNVEWNKFLKSVEDVGTKLSKTQEAYDTVIGTRKRQLEKPLNQIKELQLNNDNDPLEASNYLELVEENE